MNHNIFERTQMGLVRLWLSGYGCLNQRLNVKLFHEEREVYHED